MKNIALAILLVTTLTLAGLYAQQRAKARQVAATMAALNQDLDDARAQLAEHEQHALTLQEHLENTRAKVVAKAGEVAQLQQVPTNQPGTNGKAGNPLADMFKNPEMKDFIKNQQKTVLSGMIDKNYAPFFNGVQLTPEQAATLKELITKKSLAGVNLGMAMMGGDEDPAKRKEMLDQVKTETDAVDAEIKKSLGDANYAQFQDYEKSMPDRMAVSSFKDQLASGPNALTPDQEQQLIQAMGDERQHFKFTTDFSDKSKFEGDFSTMFTEEKIAQFQSEQEQLNNQYLARAQNILSTDQLGPYEKYLASQRELQAVGMKMAVKMFGGKSGAN